jgi:small subunit ribosomal protein S9
MPVVKIEGNGANDSLGTGRRKSSVARVRIRPGSGKIAINRRDLENYFPLPKDRNDVMASLNATGKALEVDVIVKVHGGGVSGQSGAILLGIARALKNYDATTEEALRENGLLTRDSRMKERKKPGLHGARRGTQFSKR